MAETAYSRPQDMLVEKIADTEPAQASVASPATPPQTSEPDQQSPRSDKPQLKRRNSSDSDQSAKRPRLEQAEDISVQQQGNPGTNGTSHSLDAPTEPASDVSQPAPQQIVPRRRNRQDDEKKRGKRLFGGLLGTLSQSSTSSAQRRRAEIEKKQQAKLQAQDEEREEDKRKRFEELTAQRKVQQRRWDEQAMRLRHSNERAMAGMLSTKSEPKIFYLPYDLRTVEKDIIQRQRDDVEEQIARDSQANENVDNPEPGNLLDINMETMPPETTAILETARPEAPENFEDSRPNGDNEAIDGQHSTLESPVDTGDGKPEVIEQAVEVNGAIDYKADESEDVMVEAGEDSVIY